MTSDEKLREACGAVVRYLGDIIPTKRELDLKHQAKAALDTPRRNCDVGDLEEQQRRFKAFCDEHHDWANIGRQCGKCPCYEKYKASGQCSLTWAQMPYGEETGDE